MKKPQQIQTSLIIALIGTAVAAAAALPAAAECLGCPPQVWLVEVERTDGFSVNGYIVIDSYQVKERIEFSDRESLSLQGRLAEISQWRHEESEPMLEVWTESLISEGEELDGYRLIKNRDHIGYKENPTVEPATIRVGRGLVLLVGEPTHIPIADVARIYDRSIPGDIDRPCRIYGDTVRIGQTGLERSGGLLVENQVRINFRQFRDVVGVTFAQPAALIAEYIEPDNGDHSHYDGHPDQPPHKGLRICCS